MHKEKYVAIGIVYTLLGFVYLIRTVYEASKIFGNENNESSTITDKIIFICTAEPITLFAFILGVIYLTELFENSEH